MRGLWQTSAPSRFIDELPPDHVEVEETEGATAFGGYGVSRFDAAGFGARYETPGSRRAEAWRRREEQSGAAGASTRPLDGRAVARAAPASGFAEGARVFHIKFGPGSVVAADGPKLTIDFDRAGRKLVMESFVSPES